jgi:6-phosphogluconolactonase
MKEINDHRLPLRIFSDNAELTQAVADLLREQFAASRSQPAAVMLSGGSTPLAVFENIQQQPVVADANLHLFMSDDRHVPADDPRNNQFQVRPMLEAIGVSDERRIGIQTAGTALEGAIDFGRALKRFLESGGSIPLGFLGMGTDGHTAGLFTPEQLKTDHHLATNVDRPDGMQGISVTPVLLQKVGRIIFLLAGEGKQEMIQRLVDEPTTLTAGLATANCPQVEIWMDEAANPYA